jgi:hypothetical protein
MYMRVRLAIVLVRWAADLWATDSLAAGLKLSMAEPVLLANYEEMKFREWEII